MDRRPPFFRPGGTLDPGAESYITRVADEQLLNALLLGEYVFLLDSRQKGKSSLVARTLLKLRDHGVSTVKLDLQRIGANVTPEQWYAGLLSGLGQELAISDQLFAFWKENQTLGPLARWLAAIEKVVLPLKEGPIVIFVDEVDFVRTLPFSTDELFAGIRECFNRRAVDAKFMRLTFCLVGVATPSQLIRNPEITPFNVGKRINLSDFTLDETLKYEPVLGSSNRNGKKLLERVHYWISGHPYLTQVVCSNIASDSEINSEQAVDRLISSLFFSTDSRQREPNLSDVERRLLEPDILDLSPEERRIQMLDLYGRMLRRKRVTTSEENPIIDTLRLSGIGADSSGWLGIRNRVYRHVFDEEWRKSNLPDAEVRRLRRAAKRAVVYTAFVASVVLLAVSSTALGMWRLSTDRKGALETLGVRTQELDRVSTERQRSLLALQKRTEDLKKASDEKQRSLEELETKTEELKRVSNERERSLADLRMRSKELSIVSSERQAAILGLERRTRDLTYSNYLGQIGRAQAAIANNRWTLLPDLVKATATNPNRGWEWGQLAMAVQFGIRERSFPKWTVLEERGAGENPSVFAPDAIYRIGPGDCKQVLAFKDVGTVIPRFRKGNYRVKAVEGTRGDAIFDATTDQLLVKNRVYTQIMDIDAPRKLYLLAVDATLETLQLRTIDGDRLVTAYTGPDMVDAARFLPDGTVLSIHISQTGTQGEVRHWDRFGKTISSAKSDHPSASGLTVSSDGSVYAAWGYTGNFEIRTVDGHKTITKLEFPNNMSDVKFSGDGKQVLVGCDDGFVYLHSLKTGERLAKFAGHRSRIASVAFLKGNQGYAAVDSGGLLRIWNAFPDPAWKVLSVPERKGIDQAVMGSDGKHLVALTKDRHLMAWDVAKWTIVRSRQIPTDEKATYSLSEGSDDVVVCHDNGRIERFSAIDPEDVTSASVFSSKPVIVQALKGKNLFVGTEDKKYALLDKATLRVVKRIEPRAVRAPEEATGVDITNAFAFDEETPQFAMFLNTFGKIQIYSSENGSLLSEWTPGRSVRCMTFVNGGKQLVVSLGSAWWVRDGETVLFDSRTGKRIHQFMHPGQTLKSVQYAPQTGVLAGLTGDRDYADRVVYLWDLKSRRRIGELRTTYINEFSFSPDGKRLLTHTSNNSTRLWDSRTSEELFFLLQRGVCRFSADGRRIVQFPDDGTVRVWNSTQWK